jgi:hypothetical protein
MQTRTALFLSAILVGCGGSTSSPGGNADSAITEGGADGTADVSKTDAGTDTASPGDTLSTGDTVPPGDAGCITGCIPATVSWGDRGGHVAYTDTSMIETCAKYTHRRSPVSTDPPDIVCSQEIAACSPTVHSALEVSLALADSDVTAAFAAAPVLYGRDTRPVDGSVLVITYGGKDVSVGLDCGGTSGCTEIPPGVAKLVALLRAVDTDQLAIGTCKAAFP